ncbi:MAG TPA: hypothetical protein VM222_00070 [Planctomycetota bacterium]|nr:hypothetical protein [Planctomycetota bacterium]
MEWMRLTAALLLLATSCITPNNPIPEIERLLAQPEIDVARLDQIFDVDPSLLQLETKRIPSVGFATSLDRWFLSNRGGPVWLSKADLRVAMTFVPFLPRKEYGGRFGGRTPTTLSAPVFHPEDWVLLQPGQRIPLKMPPAPCSPGSYTYSFVLPKSGAALCRQARDFNAGFRQARPRELDVPILSMKSVHLILPSFASKGAPWHESKPIDPEPIGEGRFRLQSDLETATETPGFLELEAFILDDQDDLVFRGALRGESQETRWVPEDNAKGLRTLRVTSVYRLPETLPSGRYRLLLQAPQAEAFFLFAPSPVSHACDTPPGAHSRWISFEVK